MGLKQQADEILLGFYQSSGVSFASLVLGREEGTPDRIKRAQAGWEGYEEEVIKRGHRTFSLTDFIRILKTDRVPKEFGTMRAEGEQARRYSVEDTVGMVPDDKPSPRKAKAQMDFIVLEEGQFLKSEARKWLFDFLFGKGAWAIRNRKNRASTRVVGIFISRPTETYRRRTAKRK